MLASIRKPRIPLATVDETPIRQEPTPRGRRTRRSPRNLPAQPEPEASRAPRDQSAHLGQELSETLDALAADTTIVSEGAAEESEVSLPFPPAQSSAGFVEQGQEEMSFPSSMPADTSTVAAHRGFRAPGQVAPVAVMVSGQTHTEALAPIQEAEDEVEQADMDILSEPVQNSTSDLRGSKSAASTRPLRDITNTSANRPAKRQKLSKPTTSKKPRKASAPKGETVPVTVHRLTSFNLHNNEDEDDPLSAAAIALPARLPIVNPIDVLAQVTSEIIGRQIETLHCHPSSSSSTSGLKSQKAASKAEIKRKSKALEEFGNALADQLFELTSMLDASAALETRLKATVRRKISLREELLALKRQREDVALDMDRVRREHLAKKRMHAQRMEINEGLYDVELSIQRGREEAVRRERQGERPVWGVRGLVEGVVGDMGGEGLLERVRRFNEGLEKSAEMMESRK
ncbi:hypothetical protein LTS18_012239 [Coniosporium uncinatum]|uniref:Uncharacterized protein n=1 Tax=Coniosporium uncinatum TaxID=93489 RepID=A0ACC3DJQ6_9PEZI|nr:hypothetical protein LTS18_012239 [Coniosporium uncinatum]